MRTSVSHPIRIDPLPVGNGVVGLTFCPGKKARSLYGAPWDRDLDTDLAAVRDWGASLIVTLMERFELDRFQVPDLPERARALGMSWAHLPIQDGGTPCDPFMTRWPEARADLIRRLAAGERVMIHCRGGLGRTGLLAALLLVDHGSDPEDAIRNVRSARANTIENRAQEDFILRYGLAKTGASGADLGTSEKR